MRFVLAVSALLCALVFVRADEYDDAIRQVMNDSSITGAGVVFYDGSDPDKIVNITRGYGKTSFDANAAAQNVTADTSFMLASVSKVFVGAAVASLLEQGLLSSLDEDICDSIPNANTSLWNRIGACRNPNFPNVPVTWSMLVTHRSSLMPDISPITVEGREEPVLAQYGPANGAYIGSNATYGNPTCPLDDVQGFYRAILTPGNVNTTQVGGGNIDWHTATIDATGGVGAWSNSTAPGSLWEYSNFAIGYLAALIEYKTNQTFASYCNDVLFDKLQMPNTEWFREDLPSTNVQAVPQLPTGPTESIDIGFYCFIDYASGQLYSSANDLGKFLNAVMTNGAAGSNGLWSDEIGNLMFSCQEQDEAGNTLPAGECQNGLSWFLLDNSQKESEYLQQGGLGLFAQYDWTGGVFHSGGEQGVTTLVVILPASNVYVAVVNNIAFAEQFAPGLIISAIGATRIAAASPPNASLPSPAVAPASIPSAVPDTTDEYDDAIRQVMNASSITGASVAFYDGSDPDNIVNFTRGYGKVSSDELGEDATADTTFMLASVSKIFTGAAVASLLEKGLLTSLDEDICNSLPNSTWSRIGACRNPLFPDVPVTWRMLVTHRSSLMGDIPAIPAPDGSDALVLAQYGPANFTHFFGPTYGNPTCPLDNVQDFYHAILTPDDVTTQVGGGDIDWYNVTIATAGGAWSNTSSPGSSWAYSNFAIGYLAALIELKTNQSFASFCNEVLFDRLQMPNTAWFREDLPSTTLQAVPQFPTGPGTSQDIGFYCFIDYASGQLYSTANDLAKFLTSMLTKGVADNLWSTDIGNLLFTCQEQDELGATVPDGECQQGLSWFLLDNSQKESNTTELRGLSPFVQYDWTGGAVHEGGEYGVSTVMIILPASKVYLIILNNIAFPVDFPPYSIANAIGNTRVSSASNSSTSQPNASPPSPAVAPASVPTSVDTNAYDDAIWQVMNASSITGAGVAFYDGSDPDNIVNFTQGYGKISSDKLGEDVTADTAFMLASASKVFVGAAVSSLLEQGLLTSLDEDICDSIPNATWSRIGACRNPYFPDVPVTWRMLVTHRSSLMGEIPDIPSPDGGDELVVAQYGPANFSYLTGQTYGNPTCPLDNVQDFYHAILTPDNVTTLVGGGDIDWYNVNIEASGGVGAWSNTSAPGSEWAYSNVAVGYLAALIEFKTNQSFVSYCNEVLFDKLQMPNTEWFREDLPSTTLQAVPQLFIEQGISQDIGYYCFIDYASGQLYSTANDLAKFLTSMLTKGVADNLWSEDIGNLLFTCQEQDETGVTIPDGECQQGLSWFLLDNSLKESNLTVLRGLGPFVDYDWTGGAVHEGGEYGVNTMMVILPAAKVYLAAISNIAFLDRFGPGLIADAIGNTRVAGATNSSTTSAPVAAAPSPISAPVASAPLSTSAPVVSPPSSAADPPVVAAPTAAPAPIQANNGTSTASTSAAMAVSVPTWVLASLGAFFCSAAIMY